jgi:hypothetical protein
MWPLLPTVEKFPKRVRFTFADRINNQALDIVEYLIEARYSRDKGAILVAANLKLEKLRVLLRLCHLLGVSIFPGTLRLNHRSIKRFRRKFKSKENAYLCGAIDDDRLSSTLSALFGHIRHADTCHLRRNVIRHTMNPG